MFRDGSRYCGEFKDNVRHGRGKVTFADNNSYEGEYRNDMQHGQGVFKWADGKSYEGKWKDNMRDGQGIVVSDKFTYSGQFKNDKMHGNGKVSFLLVLLRDVTYAMQMMYNDGRLYTGSLVDDVFCGMGTMNFLNDEVYHGEWRDSL